MPTTGAAPVAPAAPAAPPQGSVGLDGELEEHRAALIAHCRRLLGSAFEAEDAVQETFVRAWRAFDRFERRSSLRTWLHRIATNVCLDMRDASQRRARPVDLAPWQAPMCAPGDAPPGAAVARPVSGCHASRIGDDPAERAVTREAIHGAFVAALLHLPARQRSVLLLRDVLRWKASEVAELLGTTVTSVNSTLQRARSNIAAGRSTDDDGPPRLEGAQRPLVAHYVDAFEHHDVDSLVSLLV
jgi:RNA polymerase sigma-70 factor (ECF subfamily)